MNKMTDKAREIMAESDVITSWKTDDDCTNCGRHGMKFCLDLIEPSVDLFGDPTVEFPGLRVF